MPKTTPSAEQIERLQRRRTRLLLVQGAFFVIWQSTFFVVQPHDLDAARTVDHVRIGAYLVWAVLLLAFLGTGGGLILPRQVRAVLNDESTVEHRRRAMSLGFWAAMAAAIGCYVILLFDRVTALETIHIVLSAGIGVALLTFGMLERRAQQDG